MIVLMDDESPESYGQVIMAAEKVQPDDVTFMATHVRGLICLSLTEERCQQLNLPLMVQSPSTRRRASFTVSIEASEGVTTGISSADRAVTIHAAIAKDAKPSSLVQPGHIFPLMSHAGGVLSRAGYTEAGCDFAAMAGFEPAAVIAEIMNDDGSMARGSDLVAFAQRHELKLGTIADLIHHRCKHEKTIEQITNRTVKTAHGPFQLTTFRDIASGEFHFALHLGDISADETTLVRVHVLDAVRDVLTIRKESDEYLLWTFQEAMKAIKKTGKGVAVLICDNQSSADIEARIEAFVSGQARTYSKDHAYRQVGTGAQILRALGVHKMQLMSAPLKFSAISGFDLEVVDVITQPEAS